MTLAAETTPTLDQIVAAVKVAVGKRNDAKDALAARIERIAEQALDTGIDEIDLGGGFVLAQRAVGQTVSQWGNGHGNHLRTENKLVVLSPTGTTTVTATDNGYFDGHNHQYPRGPATHPRATVATLRAVARDLPGAVAAALVARRATVEAQEAACRESLATLSA